MAYIEKALKGVPETPLQVPTGIVALRINPSNGLREGDGRPGIADYFYQEYAPRENPEPLAGQTTSVQASGQDVRNQLF